jgi:exodeoxyribonuclease V alpha subunit
MSATTDPQDWIGRKVARPAIAAMGAEPDGQPGAGDLLLVRALARGRALEPAVERACALALGAPARSGSAGVWLHELEAEVAAREALQALLLGSGLVEKSNPGEGALMGTSPFVIASGLLMTRRSLHWHEVIRERWRHHPDAAAQAGALATGADAQASAVAAALRQPITVIAGGPGTGKTFTIGNLLAQAYHASPGAEPRVALAAPTGRAAARLTEGLSESAERHGAAREWVVRQAATTLHRLLDLRPDATNQTGHGPDSPLPHDLVVVDECSMVDLALMARLISALKPDARLVLVGDPEQLASVEAGTVLADLIAAAGTGGIVQRLHRRHRFGEASDVAKLADAIVAGDKAAVVGFHAPAGWIDAAGRTCWIDEGWKGRTSGWKFLAEAFRPMLKPAEADTDAGHRESLELLHAQRVLCLHRHGPWGSLTANARLGQELFGSLDIARQPVAGLPVLCTRNLVALGLANGDLGVAVVRNGGLWFLFELGGRQVFLAPGQVAAWEPALAMTVHKSQGSQATHVCVLLPDEPSRLCTREALYTGVTRARSSVVVVGPRPPLEACVDHRIRRASVLSDWLVT